MPNPDFSAMEHGTLRFVCDDGNPAFAEITCNGVPILARSLTLVAKVGEPITALVELYVDEMEINLESATVTFTTKAKLNDGV